PVSGRPFAPAPRAAPSLERRRPACCCAAGIPCGITAARWPGPPPDRDRPCRDPGPGTGRAVGQPWLRMPFRCGTLHPIPRLPVHGRAPAGRLHRDVNGPDATSPHTAGAGPEPAGNGYLEEAMIVILHGWSDSASSFERLARSLREMGLSREIHHIRLAEYITMDDDVTFDDLAHAMERAWTRDGLPQKPRSVDMIVHSTGGLVVLHWLTRLKTPDTHPLRRLLMLAPANFGSPLAHKGRSFLGRVFKGFRSDRPFHTGAQLLKGLDLASPFAWELARRDCFGGDPWYGKDGILVTVLVGSSGYSGIQAAANSPGSDGTVLVSSANLQPVHVRMDFASDPDRPTIEFRQANATTAFCRIPGDNHSTLAWKDRGPRNGIVADLVKRALTVTPDAFMEHVRFCNRLSGEHRAADRQDSIAAYQHTVLYVVDDHGTPVEDYFIELFAK